MSLDNRAGRGPQSVGAGRQAKMDARQIYEVPKLIRYGCVAELTETASGKHTGAPDAKPGATHFII